MPHEFVGRRDDLEQLAADLADPSIRVISLVGQPGVGKTALANRLFDRTTLSRFRRRARHLAFRAGQWEGLEDWLVLSLANQLLSAIPSPATRADLEDSILQSVEEQCTLLLVDNAESLDQTWLADFVRRWLRTRGHSLLLLTTTLEVTPPTADPTACAIHRLVGLPQNEQDAILTILGDDLRGRFDLHYLLEASRMLQNIPQRLLYLRWLDPRDPEELRQLVDQLITGEVATPLAEAIRRRITGPCTHFLALGHVRTVEVAEDLLAWLWDKLGGGAAATYVDVRDQLIAQGFLTRVGRRGLDILHINPGLHIQLEKYLVHAVGPLHIGHIDYYLSEYYRREFESQNRVPDAALLHNYVYHALQAGNLRSALDFVLREVESRALHNVGLALGLRRIFALLDEACQLELDAKRDSRSRELAVLLLSCISVKIELAHAWCDLSEYAPCLASLDQAEAMLRDLSDAEAAPLRQRINYLKGIALGCLGRTLDSLHAYHAVVRDAVAQQHTNARAIEALGYIALVLSFHDMRRAQLLGEKALALANQHGQSSLIAKNKCSIAQILFFAGQIDEAALHLCEADALCRTFAPDSKDLRELERILIARSMVNITNGAYTQAVELLDEAAVINLKTSDRRRNGRAKALRGICLWRAGQVDQGKSLLEGALTEHYKISDWLNLTNEALSYAFMLGFKSVSAAIQAATLPEYREHVWARILNDPTGRESISLYGAYWEVAFRPALLS